ncbi:hexokinase A [Maudiozyma exigua]|uniref:Phosphotransferase n=1 Tax=Maudiozyma exigua TaxID=34358 RepID=A0A9P6WC88_MAUEX|nr:hexokinase A [Kazachstania exigua]
MVHLGPKKPPARKGSMADVPQELLNEIHGYEGDFTVPAEKLQAVTKHFITELDKGLSKKGGNIPMIPGWVMEFPTGKESGDYLAIDLGGTNLRVILIKLGGDRTFDSTQSKYKLPDEYRTTKNRDDLFNFIAKSLENFIAEQFPNGVSKPLPLGFTFSYPASQDKINEGILQRWTKGFDIPNVEGHDVVGLLQEKITENKIPVEVVALINDTTGTLVASLYTDSETKMGVIFGTGVNGAYYDVCSDIEKLQGRLPADITNDSPMAINCEYGSFDNEHVVLPRNRFDIQIDEESPRPGQQAFEKMSSGYYLGELLRLALLETYNKGFIFKGIKTTVPERKLIRKLSELIGIRSARIASCGVAAICQKRGYETGHIAADGSVYNRYPGFKEAAAEGLRAIYGWEKADPKTYPIQYVSAEDGSGAGAAIIAALTQKRLAEGKSVGVIGA